MNKLEASLGAIIYRADTLSAKAKRWLDQCGGELDSKAQSKFDDCRIEYDHIVEHMVNLKIMIQKEFG